MLVKSRKFARVLRELASKLALVSPSMRARELQQALQLVNDRLPPCLYFPLFSSRYELFWLLAIRTEECRVFHTNKRAPILCVAEINVVTLAGGRTPGKREGPALESPAVGQGLSEEEALAMLGESFSQQAGHGTGGESGDGEGRACGPEASQEQEPRAALGSRVGREIGAAAQGEDGLFQPSVGAVSEDSAGPLGPSVAPEGEEEERRQMMEAFYGECWEAKRRRIKARSHSGGETGWDLVAFIVKSDDDIRQEQFAMALVSHFHEMFRAARCNCWLRPYSVVATAPDSGFIEVVPDCVSLHSLRDQWAEMKWAATDQTLCTHFVRCYGPEHTREYKAAQRNFIESMAGYAVVCYLLQVKDRNDGNLLLTRDGHILHIDFGFMLSNTPGDMAFEQAPFKLTSEYVQVCKCTLV